MHLKMKKVQQSEPEPQHVEQCASLQFLNTAVDGIISRELVAEDVKVYTHRV